MRPLFVVLGEPRVQIDLQLLDRPLQLFAKGDVVKFILDRPVEAFAYAVRLRTVRLGLGMVHILDGQIKLIGVVFDLAAILGAPIRQDAQKTDLRQNYFQTF